MRLDSVSRRLEMLKLEGLGFSQAEVVKELSAKCACSARAKADLKLKLEKTTNPEIL